MKTSITFSALLLFASLFAQAENTVPMNGELGQGQAIAIATSKGGGILLNTSGEYGHGYIIGRPVRYGYDGIWWKTYELTVNQGGFADNLRYIGSDFHMSTESQEIFEAFQKLDQEANYVFEYIEKNPFDPEIEDSHYQIVAIYTPEEFMKQMSAHADLSQGVKARAQRYGSSTDSASLKGRLVDVERYGQLGSFCSFEINAGGLSQSGEGSSEALKVFAVMDNALCNWAEAALALQKDVIVDYAKDVWEIWQPASRFANSISFAPVSSVQAGGMQVQVDGGKVLLLNDIKKQLLNDPEFIKELGRLLEQQQPPQQPQ